MASLTALVCSSKYVLRNILGSKNHLKMKHCMIEIKEKNYYCQKLCRKCGQEPSPRPFQIFIKFYIKSKQTEFGYELWGILIVCHRRLLAKLVIILTFIKQLYSIIKKKVLVFIPNPQFQLNFTKENSHITCYHLTKFYHEASFTSLEIQ